MPSTAKLTDIISSVSLLTTSQPETITTPLRRSRSASAKGSPIVTTEQPSQTNERDSNCETVEVDLFDDLLTEVIEDVLHQAVQEITHRFQDDWGKNSMSWDDHPATTVFEPPPVSFTFSAPSSAIPSSSGFTIRPSMFNQRPIYPFNRPTMPPPILPSTSLRAFAPPYIADITKSITYLAPSGYSSVVTTGGRRAPF